MLTASPSPRLHSSEGSTFPSPRNGNHQRSGSSSSNLQASNTSPIGRAHLAHVYAAETSRYPTFATSSTTNQSINKTHSCSQLSSSRPALLRSTGTQTSPTQLIENDPIKLDVNSEATNSRPSMIDAHTQYSPPDIVHESSARSATTPVSPLLNLKLRESSTSQTQPAKSQKFRRIPYDPVADASMPAGPTGALKEANTTTSQEKKAQSTVSQVDAKKSNQPPSKSTNISPPSSKRHHSTAEATQPPPKQNENETDKTNSPYNPLKKMRPDDADVKLMPADYSMATTRDLVLLISSMLMELIRYNDAIPLGNNQLTRFHSRAPPGISVIDYLQRLTTHATLSPPILLSMVYYIDKLCALYPAFTISSLTVHRFLITAATVASKGLSDSFWTNKTYARVGGVSIRELALLELEFLVRVQWRIVPQPEVLIDYYRSLVARTSGYAMEDGENNPVASVNGSISPSCDAG